MVQGSVFGVQCSVFRVQGSRFMVQVLGVRTACWTFAIHGNE